MKRLMPGQRVVVTRRNNVVGTVVHVNDADDRYGKIEVEEIGESHTVKVGDKISVYASDCELHTQSDPVEPLMNASTVDEMIEGEDPEPFDEATGPIDERPPARWTPR